MSTESSWNERVFSDEANALRSLDGAEVLRVHPRFRIELGAVRWLDGVTLVLTDGRVLDLVAKGNEEGEGSLEVEVREDVVLHDCDCPATNSPPDACVCRGDGAAMRGGMDPIFDTPEGRA